MSTATSNQPSASWGESIWTLSALIAGLALAAMIRLLDFVGLPVPAAMPYWLQAVVGMVVLYGVLFAYPLWARCPTMPGRWRMPKFSAWMVEGLVAVLVVVICLVLVSVVELVLQAVAPGATMTPQFMDQISYSQDYSALLAFAAMACILAPVGEEIFFRGFLLNALGSRMPMLFAVGIQAVIFGFIHPYSIAHSIGATVLGLALGVTYLWRRTILTPMLAHCGINLIAVLSLLAMMQAYGDSPMLGVSPNLECEECIVDQVTPGMPAEQAGVQPGDQITGFGEYSIRNFQDLLNGVRLYEAGDEVKVTVKRGEETLEFTAVLASRSDVEEP